MSVTMIYHLSNMYCSDDESEQPCDANLDSLYDEDKSFYDEFVPNPPLYSTELVDRGSFEARFTRRLAPPPLVVLTSMTTENETGCMTMKDYDAYLDTKQKQQEEAQRRQQQKDREIKEKAEQAEQEKWAAILASLPTESRLGKKKRLEKEAAERELRAKLTWAAKKKKGCKPLPFGHRRNGGGKSRAKVVEMGSAAEKRQIEVQKARRALKRKMRKEKKRQEEGERQVAFANSPASPSKAREPVTPVDYIVESDSEDEETKLEKKLEAKLEQEKQMEIVRVHLLTREEKNLPSKEELQEKKEKEERARKQAKKEEEESWTRVGKEKKKVEVIKLVTPKMAEKEKVETGLAKLMDTKNMRRSLVKSKLCRSVGTNTPCPHGANCRYAHSVDELQVPECFFKDACNRVRKTAHGYKNCRGSCMFLHPGENMAMYCKRVGIKEGRVREAVQTSCQSKPACASSPRPNGPRLADGTPMPHGSLSVPRQRRFPAAPVVNPWHVKNTTATDDLVEFGVSIGLDPAATSDDQGAWSVVERKKPASRRRRTPKSSGPRDTSRHRREPQRAARKNVTKKQRPMCRSVGTGQPCPHGANCRFRHI